jgi:RNA methyltransferase, TrmH family
MRSLAESSPRRVESRQNARVKELRAGLSRGMKTAHDHIAVEGLHLVQEAVKSGLKLDTVFLLEGREELAQQFPSTNAEILILSQEVFASAAMTEHPQGVAALVEAPQFKMQAMFPAAGGPAPLVILAGGLQDPGNLGTLVRSAEAFGATGMILLPGTVSLWNAKTLRASSGSAFRLPVVALAVGDAFHALRDHGVRILAAVARAGDGETDLRGPTALLIGNEASGLPEDWIARADARVTIPFTGAVESLNAAIAGSVLLYDAMRQRRKAETIDQGRS